MKDFLQDDTIDLRLAAALKLLRQTPPRDPKAVEASQARFLAELDELFPAEETSPDSVTSGPGLLGWLRGAFRFGPVARPVVVGLGIILLVFVFLFGGVAVTARASQSALPGDRLYTVKTGLEMARLSFAGSLSKESRLYMEFASTRLDEIQRLIEAGRYEEAIVLSGEFHTYVERALEAANQLSTIDPAEAARLNGMINARLSEYTVKLGKLISNLPDQVQSQMESNLPAPAATPSAVQGAGGNGGQNEINASQATNGTPNPSNNPTIVPGAQNETDDSTLQDQSGDDGNLNEDDSGEHSGIENHQDGGGEAGENEDGSSGGSGEDDHDQEDGGHDSEDHERDAPGGGSGEESFRQILRLSASSISD